MTTAFRLRLGILILATVLVAGLTLRGVQQSLRRIHALQDQLTTDHIENFRLADEFQKRLLKVNISMLHYVVRPEETNYWDEFVRARDELDRWIDHYDTRLNPNTVLSTERERELAKQINDTYSNYVAASYQVRPNQQPALESRKASEQLTDFERQGTLLLELDLQLAEAHRAAETSFLEDANHLLANLRAFFFGGVAFMLLLVGALGIVIYRDQIAPLRTMLVRSQVMLEKQEKLATLGTLAAGIAHEIRNPLTSVKARLYTLDKHLEAPPLARKDAEIISAEITRLERIVQEVLRFARPSEPELKVLNAQTLLHEAHALMATSLQKQQVEIVLEPGPDLFITADAAHLKQVLINLMRNAAEAIDSEGKITLRARTGHAALDGHDCDTVILEVSDTGRGIAPEIEKRLFDPFFSTKETGTGLGLSIAARIVEKHGGALQYQTRVGHGTTFGIVLPQTPSTEKPVVAVTPPGST